MCCFCPRSCGFLACPVLDDCISDGTKKPCSRELLGQLEILESHRFRTETANQTIDGQETRRTYCKISSSFKDSNIFHRAQVEDIDGGLKDKGEAKSIQCKYHRGEGSLTLATTTPQGGRGILPHMGREKVAERASPILIIRLR